MHVPTHAQHAGEMTEQVGNRPAVEPICGGATQRCSRGWSGASTGISRRAGSGEAQGCRRWLTTASELTRTRAPARSHLGHPALSTALTDLLPDPGYANPRLRAAGEHAVHRGESGRAVLVDGYCPFLWMPQDPSLQSSGLVSSSTNS